MNILGIDPGTGRTGWGAIKKLKNNDSIVKNVRLDYIGHGCIVTKQEDTMSERLLVIYQELNKIIKEFKPQVIIIEQIFFGKNTKTAISVGQARGVVMLAAARYHLPVFEYTGISVKHHLSGNGRADKKSMQKIVRRLLNKDKRQLSFDAKDRGFDDAGDALAIAIHHALKS